QRKLPQKHFLFIFAVKNIIGGTPSNNEKLNPDLETIM
ncbi:MAG: hypothetical protein ACI9XB_002118, partial [Gammaproteobacteria bacterium]